MDGKTEPSKIEPFNALEGPEKEGEPEPVASKEANLFNMIYRKVVLIPYLLIMLYPSYFLANLSVQEYYGGSVPGVVFGTLANVACFFVAPALLIFGGSFFIRCVLDLVRQTQRLFR